MDKQFLFFILSLSISFAAILGVIRFRKMDTAYHPFIYYTWLSLMIEIAVFVLLSFEMDDSVGVLLNISALTEFYLLASLFLNWGLFKRNKKFFYATIAFFFLLYFSTIFERGYNKRNHLGSIANSFGLIFFSISAFNTMILNERINIFKNAKFWICIGIVIFYTCSILVSTGRVSFVKQHLSQDFIDSVWQIKAYSNLLVNLLYAVAVIWIPRKKNIITLF